MLSAHFWKPLGAPAMIALADVGGGGGGGGAAGASSETRASRVPSAAAPDPLVLRGGGKGASASITPAASLSDFKRL